MKANLIRTTKEFNYILTFKTSLTPKNIFAQNIDFNLLVYIEILHILYKYSVNY